MRTTHNRSMSKLYSTRESWRCPLCPCYQFLPLRARQSFVLDLLVALYQFFCILLAKNMLDLSVGLLHKLIITAVLCPPCPHVSTFYLLSLWEELRVYPELAFFVRWAGHVVNYSMVPCMGLPTKNETDLHLRTKTVGVHLSKDAVMLD